MGKETIFKWNTAKVRISEEYIIEDRTMMTEKEYREFCERHNYELLGFEYYYERSMKHA